MDSRGQDPLAAVIAAWKADGARLVSYTDPTAIMARGRPLRHTVHFVTLLTFGAWGPFWIALELFGGERRMLLSRDESGEVTVRRLRHWSWWTVVAVITFVGMLPAALAILKYG